MKKILIASLILSACFFPAVKAKAGIFGYDSAKECAWKEAQKKAKDVKDSVSAQFIVGGINRACNYKFDKDASDAERKWADCFLDGVEDAPTKQAAISLKNYCDQKSGLEKQPYSFLQ